MRALLILLLVNGFADAAPSGYQCYPGKPKLGVGCSCPTGYKDGRDTEGNASCARVPLQALGKQVIRIDLITREWTVLELPAFNETSPIQPSSPPPPSAPPSLVITSANDDEVRALKVAFERAGTDQRIAAHHAWASALARHAKGDVGTRTAAIAAYKDLVSAAGFAAYPRADVGLFEYGELLAASGATKEAGDAFLKLLTNYPSSPLIPDVYVWHGERLLLEGDRATARGMYERAVEFPKGRLYAYARWRLGTIHLAESRAADAVRELEIAAITPDLQLRWNVLRALGDAFVALGVVDEVIARFDRLDVTMTFRGAEEVAKLYAKTGKTIEARKIYRGLVTRAQVHSNEAERCLAARAALTASVTLGDRDAQVSDADAVTLAADWACMRESSHLLASIARDWHLEALKTQGDLRRTIAMWERVKVATNDLARTDAIQRNIAVARWEQATRAGGARVEEWIAAGEAMQGTSRADVNVAAIEAYDNALRVVAATRTRLAAPLAARLRAGLANIGSDRAKLLLTKIK